jgi:hypothetical protein
MSIFEIQIVSNGRWKSNDAFEDYDAAYECAERIERRHQPEQLRIRRLDITKSGMMRETTIYDGGCKFRRDKAEERRRQEQDALRQRVADRRNRQMTAKNARQHKNLFSSSSPVYLTLVSLSICLTGLSALYLVEKAFMS